MKALFPEFKPFSAAAWKDQLVKDLKGEAYENLIWHNENGFDVQPFYTSESLQNTYDPAFTHANWDICVHTFNEKTSNSRLLSSLARGATSISVATDVTNYPEVLKDIQLDIIRATFFISVSQISELHAYLKKKYTLDSLKISLVPSGIKNIDELKVWQKAAAIFSEQPFLSTISSDVLTWHNQNSFAYYEVALSLALLIDQLELIDKSKLNSSTPIVIKTGVNSDYFIQIAKLRAIRRLWLLLRSEYKLDNPLHIICETSLTNKSISDSYNNLLRTTIEGMAAVAGGCNELIINEFDLFAESDKKLAERMAVNQQLILKEESYLDKMADISCGSFYIESITDAIAEKALQAFKEIEKAGGYFQSIMKGEITKEVTRQASEREKHFTNGKAIAIGVNKFKNEKEKLSVTAEAIDQIKNMGMNNPLVNFEIQQFFNLKNA